MPVKKKTVKASVKKTAPKTRRRASSSSSELYFAPVTFRRIVLITTCLILSLFAVLLFKHNGNITQSVAGISVARGAFAQATIAIPQIPGAVAYNIYFKEQVAEKNKHYTNAVRKIPANVSSYTISYLKKNTVYIYKISAVNSTGTEFLWSEVQTLSNTQPMQ